MGDYSKFGVKSYEELIREKGNLETEYKDIEEECGSIYMEERDYR
jgi:hypothetical protein